MTAPEQLIQKLWNTCNILRDDGLSFRRRGGYGGQAGPLAFRLFLKRAEERANRRGLLASAGFAGKQA